MSENKNDTEVTVSDLKTLGRQGNVTARLDSGEVVRLSHQYALRERTAVIAGQVLTVEVKVFYSDIYKQIRTIKRDGVLIARKVKHRHSHLLQLTGKGYHRNL